MHGIGIDYSQIGCFGPQLYFFSTQWSDFSGMPKNLHINSTDLGFLKFEAVLTNRQKAQYFYLILYFYDNLLHPRLLAFVLLSHVSAVDVRDTLYLTVWNEYWAHPSNNE